MWDSHGITREKTKITQQNLSRDVHIKIKEDHLKCFARLSVFVWGVRLDEEKITSARHKGKELIIQK